MKLMEGALEEKGGELDKEKFKMLIAEYRKFKTKNVRHFRFNSAENSSGFGTSLFGVYFDNVPNLKDTPLLLLDNVWLKDPILLLYCSNSIILILL